MESQKYYFITVMEKLETSKYGFPENGMTRCWGFYKDKETAFKCLHENWTDLWETCYDYAVIEEYEEGISNCNPFFRQFFKYNREENSYVEIEEPESYKHFNGFAFG